MLVVVSAAGDLPAVQVLFQAEEPEPTATAAETEAPAKEPPNPILPVGQEILYAFFGFMVLFVVMRFWLFPRFKAGMDARYAGIRAAHDDATRIRSSAEQQAAAYEAGIAEARAEANRILDAARHEVEADRQVKLAAANARIAEKRAAAVAENEAAKQAAMGHVEEAVAEVAAALAGRALGRSVEPGSVRPVVTDVMRAGVAR